MKGRSLIAHSAATSHLERGHSGTEDRCRKSVLEAHPQREEFPGSLPHPALVSPALIRLLSAAPPPQARPHPRSEMITHNENLRPADTGERARAEGGRGAGQDACNQKGYLMRASF